MPAHSTAVDIPLACRLAHDNRGRSLASASIQPAARLNAGGPFTHHPFAALAVATKS